MISNKICMNCGCSEIISDRSLGGRLVCLKCGSSTFGKKSYFPSKNKKHIYILIAIIVVLLILIF